MADPFNISDILSPKTSITPQFTSTVGDVLSPRTNVDQAGLFNLKGQLGVDLSTDNTKKSLIYAPIYQLNSPQGRISSNPSTSQTTDQFPLLPILLIGGGLLVLGVFK